MRKILYFDTETTGTDPVKNGIIQLSGMIEIDGEIREEFNFRMAPMDLDIINDQALAVNGITRDQLKTYPSGPETYLKIVQLFSKYIDRYDKLDKFYPSGYNVRFDLDFLNNFFRKNKDPYFGSYCNWRAIDALSIAHFLDYMGQLRLPDYKLATVCSHYKVPIQAHDALSDIKATRDLLTAFKALLPFSPINRHE